MKTPSWRCSYHHQEWLSMTWLLIIKAQIAQYLKYYKDHFTVYIIKLFWRIHTHILLMLPFNHCSLSLHFCYEVRPSHSSSSIGPKCPSCQYVAHTASRRSFNQIPDFKRARLQLIVAKPLPLLFYLIHWSTLFSSLLFSSSLQSSDGLVELILNAPHPAMSLIITIIQPDPVGAVERVVIRDWSSAVFSFLANNRVPTIRTVSRMNGQIKIGVFTSCEWFIIAQRVPLCHIRLVLFVHFTKKYQSLGQDLLLKSGWWCLDQWLQMFYYQVPPHIIIDFWSTTM